MNPQDTMLSKVKAYLADRRQTGFALNTAGKQLFSFARFADHTGYRGALTLELASRWAMAKKRRLEMSSRERRDLTSLRAWKF